MTAKWQKWMPFHIDRFMGSRYVQAMHPAARSGYIYLLAAQWQSDDCMLPSDEEELAALSGLGALWRDFSRAILRNFVMINDGKIRNIVLFEEWSEALRVFEARRKGARATNERTADGERTPSDTATARSARRRAHTQTQTQTQTVTETVKQKQKPSGDATPEGDSRHAECRVRVHAYWKSHHPDAIEAPWDGGEAKQLKSLLAANPRLSPDGFQRLLDNRARSDVNHSARPRDWLAKLTDFTRTPLDRFNKPKGNGDGTGQVSSGQSAGVGRVERSGNAFRDAARRSVEAAGGGDAGPDGSRLSLAGGAPGHGADVPARDRAADSGVRDSAGDAGARVVSHPPEILSPSQRSAGGTRSHGD